MTRLLQDVPDTHPVPSSGPPTKAIRPMSPQLLERRGELARIESALAEARGGRRQHSSWSKGRPGSARRRCSAAARAAAAESGMRVLRSRGTELERDFAFGVVRQLFELPLAEASEPERADLLQAAAGVAARTAWPPGRESRPDSSIASGVDPSFAILHGLYWLCANLAAAGPALRGRRRRALGGRSVAALPGLPAHATRGARRRADRRDPPAARRGPTPSCWRP